MPLSEFLRMVRGKLEPGQQIPYSTDLSSRGGDDLVELVWENGQIVMQGQSSRVTRNPNLHNMLPNPSRVRDSSTISRTGKFGGVESFLNDISPVVPSGDLDLGQDDEMVFWLNHPMDDPLPNYCEDLLPEISGVKGNGMSTQNSFVPAVKKSSFENGLKVSSSSKNHLFSSWPPQQGQIPDPSLGSGVSDIVSINSNNIPNVTYGNSAQQRDIGMTSNNSNSLNFTHFTTLVKSNLPNSDEIPVLDLQPMEIKDKALIFNVNDRFNTTQKGIDIHAPPAACTVVSSTQPVKESFLAKRTENLCRGNSFKNEKPLIIGNGTTEAAKGVIGSERTVEPMVASSSVGSGNSVDRLSNEPTHNSKRKFRDIEYSESQGDDIETEFADVKKPNSGRGGNGSKRSRAAEVHNLSERRRRDRINEKMRALQELIPNCNKADKASMLDEAIEYLKTLQLQVQIMSMGVGLCIPPMMFPTGMLLPHMAHFSPLGVGMSMGMGFGMGMVDMNGGSSSGFPGPSMHGAQYHPSPMPGPMMNFPRIPGPVYGHPSSLTRAPLVTSAMGLSAPIIGSHNELPLRSPTFNLENPLISKNSQLMKNVEASSSIKHSSSNQVQSTKQVAGHSGTVQENKQATDVIRGTAALNATESTTDISKEVGGDVNKYS